MVTPKQHTILYIEDDLASQRLVERMLKFAGYAVLLANRGLNAIDLARQHQPDLILTDINLPDLSGYEIATMLRSDPRFATTPIVALTAMGYSGHSMAMAAGITGYLTKPVDVERLIKQLKFYLEGGQDAIEPTQLREAQIELTREVVQRLETRIRELEAGNAELLKLDKLKQNFIQITAHELRTPLTLVFGYSRLLEDYPALQEMMNYDDTFQMLMTGLMDSINRMHLMVEEILITSRIMTNDLALNVNPTQLGEIAQGVVHNFANVMSERGQTMHFEARDWPPQMFADSDMLRLALNNLVGNAIKYTPDGGHIYVSASYNLEYVQVTVRDTGIGIDPHDHDKIFDQFHTLGDFNLHTTSKTAYKGGGLGLGLSVVKGIVEAHGGTIRVESAGRDERRFPGTAFVMTLPLAAVPVLT